MKIRLAGIIIFAIFLLMATECSCEKTDAGGSSTDSSSSSISMGSSIAAGDSVSNPPESNQNGSSGISDIGDSSVPSLETPVENASELIGRWEYIYEDPNGNWVFVLMFSEDGKLHAFPAPQGLGADNWFDGDFTVADGTILYNGQNEEYDLTAPDGILSSPISGTFLASITNDGNLILRGDKEDGLLSSVIVRDVKYKKVQDNDY